MEILILFVLLLLSGLFSGAEAALISLSPIRVESLCQEGRKGAKALLKLKENSNRMLIVLLFGNNVVNIAASSIATVLATKHFGQFGPGMAVGLLTFVILVFGEITPKTLAVRHAVSISLTMAGPLLLFSRLVSPITWFLEHINIWLHSHFTMKADPTVTEMELVNMASHGASEGTIEHDEREMIERIFAFDTLRAGDVMIPRSEVISMDGSLTIRESLTDILSHPHGRIPLHAGDPDEVSKVVYLRDILAAIHAGHWDKSLVEISHTPMFVPMNQRVDGLLEMLRKKKERTIIVVGPFGNMRGMCTLEDLVEELVGEIYDDKDSPKELFHPSPSGELLVEGKVNLRRVQEHFRDVNLTGKPTDSVNEWILRSVKRIPAANEQFVIDELWVVVEKASLNRIHHIRMTLRKDMPGSNTADTGR